MPTDKKNYDEVDAILKAALASGETLKDKFDLKLAELNISQRRALDILGIEQRALLAILEGTSKQVDITGLFKIATFLGLTNETSIRMYLEALNSNFGDELGDVSKRKYLVEKFDLVTLKKEGIIESLSDFNSIEKSLINYFGYTDIKEYDDYFTPAFSKGKRHKHNKTVDTWLKGSKQIFKEINNQKEYDRQALIDYFPEIRWHSMNLSGGLTQVIKSLYQRGITVFFRTPSPNLDARGVTFAVHNKPCIALTKLSEYYPTLWFTLIHELYHVLFDWEEIKANEYLISSEHEQDTPQEQEANKFASDYLLSKDKLDRVKKHINDVAYVTRFAANHHLHPSFVYTSFAWEEQQNGSKMYWSKFSNLIPSYKDCLKPDQIVDWKKPAKLEAQKIKTAFAF